MKDTPICDKREADGWEITASFARKLERDYHEAVTEINRLTQANGALCSEMLSLADALEKDGYTITPPHLRSLVKSNKP